MKRYFPRLIAWSILVLAGIVVVLSSFSVDLLIMVAVTLGLLALAVFAGKGHSLVRDLPWFAAGWIFLTILIPRFGLTPATLSESLRTMMSTLDNTSGDSLLTMGFLTFLAAQLFLRKRDKLVFILLRYATACLLLLGLREAFFGSSDVFYRPLAVIVLLSLLYELKTWNHGYHRRRTLSCVLSSLACFMVAAAFGERGITLIESLFALTDSWLYIVIGAAIMGFLMLLEEHNNQKTYDQGPSAHADLGGVLLFWCLLCLIMHLWEATMNWTALVILPMVLYYCYGPFMKRWKKRVIYVHDSTFSIVWGLCTLGALVFGKSLNTTPVVAILMILLLIAAGCCWALSTRYKNEDLIMTSYLGVAAAVLTGGVIWPGFTDAAALTKVLIGVAVTGLMWCFLCSRTTKLNYSSTKFYPREFHFAWKAQEYAPMVVIAIIVLRILFA